MGKVKILPKSVYSKIQAGEIIESPVSVIRELIDNSIDAKANYILIELIDSGFDKIIVKDNGEGIEKDDLKLVFKNHATSKIFNEKDLMKISSLGFRGEALYSIASVSRMNIKSKTRVQDSGYQIKIYGGKQIDFSPVPMNNGTIVTVSDLFYNIPARKKFVNNHKKELNLIKKLFMNKASASFDVEFILINNNKNIYNYTKKENFFERQKDILGDSTYKNLKKIELNNIICEFNDFIDNFKISELQMLISSKDFYSKYRSYFLIVINGRPVIEEELIKKIRGFYYSYLPRGFYPYFILNIKMDPELLDQNVDPTKLKIKIENDVEFSYKIVSIIKKKLSKENIYYMTEENRNFNKVSNNNIKNLNNNINNYKSDLFDNRANKEEFNNFDENNKFYNENNNNNNNNNKNNLYNVNIYSNFDENNYVNSNRNVNTNIDYNTNSNLDKIDSTLLEKYANIDEYQNNSFLNNNISNDNVSNNNNISNGRVLNSNLLNNNIINFNSIISKDFGEFKTILFSTYLVFEKNDILYIIDYHAAYERINYNRLKNNFKVERKRALLFPVILDLNKISNKNKKNIDNKIDVLKNSGFEVEYINDNIIQIISIPDIVKTKDEESLIEEVKGFIEDEEIENLDYNYLKDKVIARIACRMSPKAHDTLSLIDIKKFLDNFSTNIENFESCPHGRPTVIKMEKAYFDKRFFRIK